MLAGELLKKSLDLIDANLHPTIISSGYRLPCQQAIDAFASALEAVPTVLAENAGLDPIDMLIELRATHKK